MAAPTHVFHPPNASKKLADEEAAAEKEEITFWNKCCCFHVTTGVLVIGILELFLLIAELAAVVSTYCWTEVVGLASNGTQVLAADVDQPPTTAAPGQWAYGASYKDYNWVYDQSPISVLCVGVGSAAVGMTVVILMMAGVKKMKARLLLPHMVAQVLGVLALFAGSAIFIYAAVTVSTSNTCTGTKQGDACTKILLSFCGFIVLFTFFAGLQIYFLIITIRCYRYIKEKCKRYQATPSPYYALYQRQMQQLQQQQQQQQQQQEGNPAQQSMSAAAAYMQQHQPIYASYAQPYGVPGYGYGYRYA